VLDPGARPLVMGILNVTADSFSDGGRFLERDAALRRGLALAEAGADIVDIGGESTRPGALPVALDVEWERVIPVVRGLAEAFGGRAGAPVLSVDTRKAAVAEAALAAGAHIVNDVTALTGDAAMPGVVARYGAGVVLMHMRGEPATMQQEPRYGDVTREVTDFLRDRMEALERAGVARETMALDPGIGFGKTAAHNLALLNGLPALTVLGRPVLVGVSRKRFIGELTGREVGDRLAGSLAAMVFAVLRGAAVVRVHDVKESVDAVSVVAGLREAGRA
jgi:dihydropteroate synthase